MNQFCTTITRYYGVNEQDLQRLNRFITQAKTYSKRILVGVHVEKDLSNAIKNYSQLTSQSPDVPVEFLPIQPWVGISTPLNILLNRISSEETFVLMQSVEIECQPSQIDSLRKYFQDEHVLCAGVALDGHERFSNSSHESYLAPLEGLTSPWNTFCLWDFAKLRRTGFPLCADFVDPPGMEDSAVIGLQQKLFGGREQNRALLIHFHSNVQWLTEFKHDQERLVKHQLKMQSKNARTKQLLEILDISSNDQIGIEYIQEALCES